MKRIVLDAGARGFEFRIARLCQRLRAGQVLGQLDVGSDVPVDADDLRGHVGRDIDLADRANDPRPPVAEVQPILRFVAPLFPCRFKVRDGAFDVRLVELVSPVPVIAEPPSSG